MKATTDLPLHTSIHTRVVHALRLVGFADFPKIMHLVTAMDGPDAEPTPSEPVVQWLDQLVEGGDARFRSGRMSGWMLTASGRKLGEHALAEELDGAGLRDPLHALYRSFLALNAGFLTTCSEWQVRALPDGEKVVNDHADARYDGDIIARIEGFDDQVQPLCAELGSMLVRFEMYGRRFTHAIEQVRRGETDWVATPSIDSYHSVWFELHEDLLATLGIERHNE